MMCLCYVLIKIYPLAYFVVYISASESGMRKWDGEVWSGFIWLRVETGSGLLTRLWAFGFHESQGIFWYAEWPQKRFCSMESVSQLGKVESPSVIKFIWLRTCRFVRSDVWWIWWPHCCTTYEKRKLLWLGGRGV